MSHRIALGLLLVASAFSTQAEEAVAPAPVPQVYFISPADGATVRNPVRLQFGLTGMGIAPAGVEFPRTGHHHLLVDVTAVDFRAPIAADEQHRHFGAGQTETELTLAPGRHTLQLLMGDHLHRPHEPPVHSEVITITVE